MDREIKQKKTRIKIPQERKIVAELQKECGSICQFCGNDDVGHFEIHHIDDNPSNNQANNLILVCPNCHSKITKGDIKQSVVYETKIKLLSPIKKGAEKIQQTNNFNGKINNAVVGNNNRVVINQKKQKDKYPEGTIGYETIKANYISHLVTRFHEYKVYEVGKENINYGSFLASLKKHYKIGSTRTIYNLPIDKFDELVQIIHDRINKTKLARIKGKNHKNYSTFDEYLALQSKT